MPYRDARRPLREMKRETASAICSLRVETIWVSSRRLIIFLN